MRPSGNIVDSIAIIAQRNEAVFHASANMKRGWFVPACAIVTLALGFALPSHAQPSASVHSAKPCPNIGLALSGGGARGLTHIGVLMVLHDRHMVAEGSVLGWIASFVSLFGITFGTLYQKRFCGRIDWRAGNTVQYIWAGVLFWLGAFAFETRMIHWNGELVFALAWLVFVLSISAVALMYWLIRRSAATSFASLFYLVPGVTALMAYLLFGERLDHLSIAGMVVCACGVVLASRAKK
jgi:drug/metabolite transporter (DMT)-like permease